MNREMSPATVKVSAKAVLTAPKASLTRGGKQSSSLAKSGSCESLEHAGQRSSASSKQVAIRAPASRPLPRSPSNLKQISRLELLLVSKKPVPVFVPTELSQASKRINSAIKASDTWTDVGKAVAEKASLSASSAAFALYRLGCLFSFASRKRNEELMASGLISTLLSFLQGKIDALDTGSVTLLLDGCARLRTRPSAYILDKLSSLVVSHAFDFDASQLPLILWAFQQLNYVPRKSVLAAMDNAIPSLVEDMTPQGISLVLAGFRAAQFQPSQRALTRLAEVSHCKLAIFKPSELATCLEAFSALGHRPSENFLKALESHTGQALHSNVVAGKLRLNQTHTLAAVGSGPPTAKPSSPPLEPFSSGVARAGSVWGQVGAKLGELHDALIGPPLHKHTYS